MLPTKQKKISKSAPPNKKNTDSRFKSMQYDPKFIAPSKNIGKVKIDKRFTKMMNNPEFKISSTVDKYGRTGTAADDQNEHLKDYYYEDGSIEQQIADKNDPKNQQNRLSRWMEQYNEVSSDDIGDEEFDELLAEQEKGVWSDDDEDVIKNQNVPVTKRLALCNYDWMNIGAKDLMLLFSSFKPASGTIVSTTVYYSSYGKQKLQLEEVHGPQGIWAEQKHNDEQESEDEKQKYKKNKDSWKKILNQNVNKQSEAFDQMKLRAYEKDRLRYCYAVIECDSLKTADQIYKECDGNQFQNSNLLFDLRFVPNETKFDQTLMKEQSNEIPVSGEVKNFVSKAVGHTNVSLSWEDPELNTAAGLKKKNWNAMSEEDMNKIDWSMYINEMNEEEDENYKKIMKKKNAQQIMEQDEEEEQQKEIANVSDWRKECNKNYRKKRTEDEDDIEITFPSGFESKPMKEEHVSLKRQVKSKKERRETIKEEKRNKQQLEMLVEKEDKKEFQYNAEDTRFKAVFDNPLFAIDPVNPKFDHRKSGKVFEEVVKRNKRKNLE